MKRTTSRVSSSSYSSADRDNNNSQQNTIRASKRAPLHIDTHDTDRRRGTGDVQKALRAIIQDRSRSASTQGDHSSSRQSDSSVQFHSSPPMQQNQFSSIAKLMETDIRGFWKDFDTDKPANEVCLSGDSLPVRFDLLLAAEVVEVTEAASLNKPLLLRRRRSSLAATLECEMLRVILGLSVLVGDSALFTDCMISSSPALLVTLLRLLSCSNSISRLDSWIW
jgi:hypothetical protein